MRRFVIPVLGSLVLGFAVVGCASTDWETRYLEKEQESRALQEQYDSMNQLQAERQASAETLKNDMDRARAEIDALAGEVGDLENRPVTADTTVSDPSVDALRRELEILRRKYGDAVRSTPDGNIEITLDSNVTFASGSHELTDEGRKILGSVAQELTGPFATNKVEVIGHTDSDPIRKSGYKDNLELGGERAFEVTRYLSARHGIDPGRMVASSRGATDPVADNATKEGKRKNRRVEILVVIPKVETARVDTRK